MTTYARSNFEKPPLVAFIAQELNNGHETPIGIAIIEVTKGPITSRKVNQAKHHARILNDEIFPQVRAVPRIVSIVAGFRIPRETFASPQTCTLMFGDEVEFGRAYEQRFGALPQIGLRFGLEKCLGQVVEAELATLGGGAVQSHITHRGRSDLEIDVLAVANLYHLGQMPLALRRWGFYYYDSMRHAVV